MELELGVRLVEDLHTGDVRGQEVGGELDAGERAVDRFGERASQRGLARARHVLDQEVALGEHAQEGEADLPGLAVDDALHIVDELLETVRVCPYLQLEVFDSIHC